MEGLWYSVVITCISVLGVHVTARPQSYYVAMPCPVECVPADTWYCSSAITPAAPVCPGGVDTRVAGTQPTQKPASFMSTLLNIPSACAQFLSGEINFNPKKMNF